MLGARVATLRKAAGMNQKQLAQELKISPSAVGMYEQGRREPPLETVAAMAKCFGVSIDFLVTGEPATDSEQEMLTDLVMTRVASTDLHLESRTSRPFSRQELAVLFAAMLMEP